MDKRFKFYRSHNEGDEIVYYVGIVDTNELYWYNGRQWAPSCYNNEFAENDIDFVCVDEFKDINISIEDAIAYFEENNLVSVADTIDNF